MKKISLTLIVKNEEKVLERCINSLNGCYDELIIVDTGSTDDTINIAKKLNARVKHFKWIDDFAAARNYALSFATGDWIMWCDADDVLEENQAKRFREIVHSHDNDDIMGINFPYIYSHESTGTGEIPNFKYHRLRIMKKESNPKWVGRIHEYNKITGKTINCDEVNFHHYRDEGKGTQNTARNLRILKKVVNDCSLEERPRHLFYYGKECIYNKLYDEAIKSFEEYIPLSNWLPEKHRAMYELAVCYQIKNDINNAIKYCFEAIKLDEDYVDPYVLLGQINYNQKRWKRAIKWFTTATLCEAPQTNLFDYIPNHTYIPYDYMAMCHWNLGNYQEGYNCVLKCLEYKPKYDRYLYNLKEFEKVLKNDRP